MQQSLSLHGKTQKDNDQCTADNLCVRLIFSYVSLILYSLFLKHLGSQLLLAVGMHTAVLQWIYICKENKRQNLRGAFKMVIKRK